MLKSQNETWFERVFLRGRRPYAWITLAVLALYLRVLSFGYTYLDDNILILDNYRFLRDWSSVVTAFTQDVFHILHGPGAYYRPMLMISLVADAHLWGLSPAGYHLTNILIHLAASGLLFAFLGRLGYSRGPVFFCSLLFAVHPALAQAVAWIPGRNDSLLGVFVLGSFLCLMDYLETGRYRSLARHIALFALALLTKETAVALVPAAAAYWVFAPASAPAPKKPLAAGWLAALLLWYWLRRHALPNPLKLPISEMLHSVWLNLPGLAQFSGKILFPFNLSVLPTLRDASWTYGTLSICLLAALVAFSRNKNPSRLAFGLSWFCLFFLPSLILHSTIVADFTLEHRVYVPMAGFMILLLETDLLKVWSGRAKALGSAVLVFYAAISFRHSGHFRSRLEFWKNAAETSPHLPLAHRNLGAMYYMDGILDQAELEYRKAERLNASEPMVHNNLGLIYARRGLFREAEAEYRKELAINPNYDHALFNLGLLYYHLGRRGEAESLWKRTLEANPDYGDAYQDLAALYREKNDPARAAYYLEEMRKRGFVR